jgi:hypothetical protein
MAQATAPILDPIKAAGGTGNKGGIRRFFWRKNRAGGQLPAPSVAVIIWSKLNRSTLRVNTMGARGTARAGAAVAGRFG